MKATVTILKTTQGHEKRERNYREREEGGMIGRDGSTHTVAET